LTMMATVQEERGRGIQSVIIPVTLSMQSTYNMSNNNDALLTR